jgi:hypothetical protein
MNLPNLNQITLKQTINNREITITISWTINKPLQ